MSVACYTHIATSTRAVRLPLVSLGGTARLQGFFGMPPALAGDHVNFTAPVGPPGSACGAESPKFPLSLTLEDALQMRTRSTNRRVVRT